MAFERWLPVIGHEGLYEVSDFGRVRRMPQARPHLPGHIVYMSYWAGYPKVGLWRGGKCRYAWVHRLVMEAFVGPRPYGCEVDHIDRNPSNAALENLRYL